MKSCAALLLILALAAEAAEQTGLLQFQRRGKFADANSHQEDTSLASGTRAKCPKETNGLPNSDCCKVVADPDECWEAGCVWWTQFENEGRLPPNGPCRQKGYIYYSGNGGLYKQGFRRAEYVKATVDGVECSLDTDDRTPCLKRNDRDQFLKLARDVPAGVYQAEMLVNCSGLERFSLQAYRVSGRATLTVFVNGQEVTLTEKHTRSGWGFALEKLWTKKTHPDSYNVLVDIKLSVEGEAAATAKGNMAVLSIVAKGNIHKFDECQQTKECMKDLQSSEGFEIRSNNALQMQCLSDELPGTHPDIHVCQTWKNCTDAHNTTAQLQSLLKAVTSKFEVKKGKGKGKGKGKSSQLQEASSSLLKATHGNSGSCIEPGVSDPESWNCECHDAMVESCGSKCFDEMSDDCARCKQELMCCFDAEDRICQTWKDEYCTDATNNPVYSCDLVLAERDARLLQRSSRSSGVKRDLVETVIGNKCPG